MNDLLATKLAGLYYPIDGDGSIWSERLPNVNVKAEVTEFRQIDSGSSKRK